MHAPTPPTHRQAPRRHAPAGAALFAALGLFAAACGGSEEPSGAAGSESQEVHLQPVAAAGPAPFTATSATAESAPVQPPLPNRTGQGIRTVNAATPGLYAGTERLGSCDVEQQVRYLTADNAKAHAFAQASDIEQAKVPEFLRGLTPVVLRADTRVTSHGFRDGRADSFQAVLQAGTAVLVDEHGMPRVRCACGNPLLAPRAAKGSPVQKGDPWNGYQPNQVVVIEPTTHAINNLVIVNIADNTWIERKRGDDGAQDRPPRVLPDFDPADGIPTGPVTPPGAGPAEPCPASGAEDCPPRSPGAPAGPGEGRGQNPAEQPGLAVPPQQQQQQEQPSDLQLSDQQLSDQPLSDQPLSDQQFSDQQLSDQPLSDQPLSDQPLSDQPPSDQPSDLPLSAPPLSDLPADAPMDVSPDTSTDVPSDRSQPPYDPIGPGAVPDGQQQPPSDPAPPPSDPVSPLESA
ncbi:hypothetical protein OG429_33420 [Streptomyces sp. NBC_00190]|uniref:DUF6777 domain-containing protein n=1 Tax=Streptomyces sp. NBC_00190 TaxID=2903634 RepID=UPI002E2B9477|nr:DUF6777 domain-containing protein [Streptomyces sp. NBC_00190]